MSCSLQSKEDPYGLKESHTNPHPPTQTHTPAWNISSVKVSRMNALNDGNVDVKTTSIQKAKCKGPTKEATGTTRKWKEEDTWESPSVVFFHEDIGKTYICTQRRDSPKLRRRETNTGPEERGMKATSSQKMGIEKHAGRNTIPQARGPHPA